MGCSVQSSSQLFKNLPSSIRLISSLLVILALGLFGSISWADEDDHGYGHDPKSHLERLTKKLDLTKEQQDKILPILEDKHKKMEALHNQMKEVRQNAISQIEAQLNPEQQEKFKKAQEERMKKMKEYREKMGKGEGHGKGKHDKED